MPWKECHVMDERLRFVARVLEGEKMAPLCAEFGISRKTGYKIYDRYKDGGLTLPRVAVFGGCFPTTAMICITYLRFWCGHFCGRFDVKTGDSR